ncbi:GNAT family N-acetyltransferase [Rhodococcus gordoniae]|uniref:GNAT family N-acetyltransferase n=1 Tax=Rhodococcus gordoniae TaxID=223392 RepID=UPI0020CC912A|nr:GNAT family protein [Rhodococcus gordoniae]UTT51235.1 GNAT family N-acetyltransferase [Rhodococcus gordoniae]
MEPVEVQLHELSSDKSHPDRRTVARWWDGLEERAALMGTPCTFDETFGQLKDHSDFPSPGQYAWGAYDTDGILAGYLIGQVARGCSKEMSFDYQVDPHRQGKGIGPAILRKMIQDSNFAQFEMFSCRVFPHNIRSVRAIEKVGFVLREGSDRDFTHSRHLS